MVKNTKSYQELNSELDKIIAKLEDPSTTIDEAIELYKEADQLIKTLKNYLDKAQNDIKILTKRSNNKAS